MTERLYLDFNATAKIRPEVIDALGSAMAQVGNASSVHGAGRTARKDVENARRKVALLVGAFVPPDAALVPPSARAAAADAATCSLITATQSL